MSKYILDLLPTIKTAWNYHIYLINNNSNAETNDELKEIYKSKKVSVIFNDTNIGVSSSWNQGIKIAREEFNIDYAVILNNDVLLHPDCIDEMIKASASGDFPLVSGFDMCKDCAVPLDIIDLGLPQCPCVVDAPEFSCYTVNIKLLDRLRDFEQGREEFPGLFDQKFHPAYFEDNDFHRRIKLASMRGVKTSNAMYYHFGSRTIKENPDIKEISNSLYLQNEQRYIEKWGGKPGKEKFKTPFNN